MKSTAIEKEQRLQTIISWITKGVPKREILELGFDQWKIGSRQIEKYLSEAKEVIVAEYKEKLKSEVEVIDVKLDYLYGESIKKGDIKTALQVLSMKSKWFGIVRDTNTDTTINFINNIPE